MASSSPKNPDESRKWRLVDCANKPVGRLATQIADMLRGKDKPTYEPHCDRGDFVVAINAAQVKLTGQKEAKKMYHRHSGYPGGIHSMTAAEMREKHPEEILRKAVKGMLPKNRLAVQLLTKLKIYPEADHPHGAQQPEVFEVKI